MVATLERAQGSDQWACECNLGIFRLAVDPRAVPAVRRGSGLTITAVPVYALGEGVRPGWLVWEREGRDTSKMKWKFQRNADPEVPGREPGPETAVPQTPQTAQVRSVVGSFDGFGGPIAQGWSWAPKEPSLRLRVRLLIDGESFAEQAADRPRDDLRAAGIGDGAHAFVFTLPDRLADGRAHCVSVVAAESGEHLTRSPRWVRSDTFVDEPAAKAAPLNPGGPQPDIESATAPLLFVHVPKTAGTTVGTILEGQYSADQVVVVVDRQDLVQLRSAGIPSHVRLVRGHAPTFVRDLFSVPPRLVTVVRDPLERIASNYRFSRSFQLTEELKLKRPDIAFAHQLSFEDFLLSDHPHFSAGLENCHVRWIGNTDPNRRFNFDQLLENAKEVLDSSIWVGVAERMPLSLAMLSRVLALPPQWDEVRINATPKQFVTGRVTGEILNRARERNRYDYELHEHACKLLDMRARDAVTTYVFWKKVRDANPPALSGRQRLFTMNDGMIGAGWWARGSTANFTSRFAFRGRPATLYFWWPTVGDAIICAWFPAIRRSCVALSLAANGIRVRLRLYGCQIGFVGVADVPHSMINDDEMAELSFHVAEDIGADGMGGPSEDHDEFSPGSQTSFSLAEIQWFDTDNLAGGLPAGLDSYLAKMRVLAEDVAELHLALACDMRLGRAKDMSLSAASGEMAEYVSPAPV